MAHLWLSGDLFLALTSNCIPCTSFSTGAETQGTLHYQLPSEEICHGATSINLCHTPSVGLNSISLMQLSWILSNLATSGEAWGQKVPGRAICCTEGGLCLTPPFLSSLVYWPLFSNFIQRQSCPVAADFDGESQLLHILIMPLITLVNICSLNHFLQPTAFKVLTLGWALKHVPMLWPFLSIFLHLTCVSQIWGVWTAAFGAALHLKWWQLPTKVQHQLAGDITADIITAGATQAVSVTALRLPIYKMNLGLLQFSGQCGAWSCYNL